MLKKIKSVKSWQWVLSALPIGFVIAAVYTAMGLANMTAGGIQPLVQPTTVFGVMWTKVPPTATPEPTATPTCVFHVTFVSGKDVLWNTDFELLPVQDSNNRYWYWGVPEEVASGYSRDLAESEPHMMALADNLMKFGYSEVIKGPRVDLVFWGDKYPVARTDEGSNSGYEIEAQMPCPSDGLTLTSQVSYSLVDEWKYGSVEDNTVWLSDGASSIQLTLPPNLAVLADPTISYNPNSPDIKIWDEKDLLLMQRPTGSFKIVWGSPMATRIYRIARDLPAMVFYQTVSDGSVQGVFQQLLLDK